VLIAINAQLLHATEDPLIEDEDDDECENENEEWSPDGPSKAPDSSIRVESTPLA
jgi:hypothetical protein